MILALIITYWIMAIATSAFSVMLYQFGESFGAPITKMPTKIAVCALFGIFWFISIPVMIWSIYSK